LSDFKNLTDLASRRLGAGVVFANDEFFAEKENLLNQGRAKFNSHTFGHKGQVYDGWETRRRRNEPGDDFAIVRLGAAGIVKGAVIDTGNFTGNFPEHASLHGASFDHTPTIDELLAANWEPLLDKVALKGDHENEFAVKSHRRWTHVKLTQHPDGGVARLRVHGEVLPDPKWIAAKGVIDLSNLENGGELIASSDDFYSSARNTLQPGNALNQGDGWENRRRRHGGNDWFAVKLGVAGSITAIEVDTSHYKGNPPWQVSVTGGSASEVTKNPGKVVLLAQTGVQADTPHRFYSASDEVVEAVRLDVFPDGGLGRFRVWGRPSAAALAELQARFDAANKK
jgi:allantoicase